MIVITTLSRAVRVVFPGDVFTLSVTDRASGEREIILSERITVQRTIDFMAAFRFAGDDGSCLFHLCGIFANSKELPREIADAVMVEYLPNEQRKRFVETCGVDLLGGDLEWRRK